MKLWVATSRDGYAFPIAVADTAGELARMTGANEKTIRSIAARNKTGQYKEGKYWCIECDEE